MKFELIPEDLPRPRAYVRSGLRRPTNSASFAMLNLTTESNALDRSLGEILAMAREKDAASVTVVDGEGRALAVVSGPSLRYLRAPSTYSLFNDPVVKSSRSSAGIIEVELAPAKTERAITEPPDELDYTQCRPVTIDLSVLLAGMDKTKFRLHDGIFISEAVDIDLTLISGSQEMPGGYTRRFSSWHKWGEGLAVPVEGVVRRIFKRLTQTMDLDRAPSNRLDRTDLYCAATAIAYDSPLYSAHPEDYAGVGHGLKVVTYGPTLNKEALSAREKA